MKKHLIIALTAAALAFVACDTKKAETGTIENGAPIPPLVSNKADTTMTAQLIGTWQLDTLKMPNNEVITGAELGTSTMQFVATPPTTEGKLITSKPDDANKGKQVSQESSFRVADGVLHDGSSDRAISYVDGKTFRFITATKTGEMITYIYKKK